MYAGNAVISNLVSKIVTSLAGCVVEIMVVGAIVLEMETFHYDIV